MLTTLSWRIVRQKFLINGCLLVLLALITAAFSAWYVSSEKGFYFWDDAVYQNWATDIAFLFHQSKSEAIARVLESFSRDYNQLYTLPLIPFILTFGDSRLVYILSIALLYFLPFSLVMGAIAAKIIPVHPRSVYWSTALLTLLLPTIWNPTLSGRPDIGGISIIALATLIYLQDVSLNKRWQIPLIGFLLAFAMLFRRHFAHSSIAFLSAITFYALISSFAQVRQHPHKALQNLVVQGVRIGLLAATLLATLILVALPWVSLVSTTNYNALYASYQKPFSEVFQYYASSYGWATWILVVLGLSAGVLTRVVALPATIFITLFGVLALCEWFVLVRYPGIHYTLHFAPFVVIGLATFIWTAGIRLKGKVRALVLGTICLYIVSNFLIVLTPVMTCNNPSIRPIFAAGSPPLISSDYKEVLRLINSLRELAHTKEPIYVAAASASLTDDLLRNAELALYQRKGSLLNIMGVPIVDSRDVYPLEQLLQAQYVVVANPFQHNMPAEEQDVVKVVVDAFTQNWEIAKDFKRLSLEFTLEGNIVVNIYQRTRPTSLETALRTLQVMQQQIGDRPGGQTDWMILSHLYPSSVVQNSDRTYKLVTHPSYRTKKPTTSYLYIGRVSQQVKVTGKIALPDNRCVGLAIRLSMLSHSGQVLKVAETVYSPGQSPNLALSLQDKNATYLLLDILSHDISDRIDYCWTEINNLSMSAQAT